MVIEHILYDFSSFKFVEVGFMAQKMVYLGIHGYLERMCVLLLLGEMFSKY